jgi:hypothetical protein
MRKQLRGVGSIRHIGRTMAKLASRIFLVGAAALALLLLAGFFYPALAPWAWHLRHGNAVRYSEKYIYVPPGWIAAEHLPALRLTKYPTILPFDEMPQGSLSLTPLGERVAGAREDSDGAWKRQFRAHHSAGKEIVRGPMTSGSGAKESVCMEAFSQISPAKISASCRLFQDEWAMEFQGSQEDLNFFLDIFRQIN